MEVASFTLILAITKTEKKNILKLRPVVGTPQQSVHVVPAATLQEFFGVLVGDRRVRSGNVWCSDVERLHVGVTVDKGAIAAADGDDQRRVELGDDGQRND